MPMAVTRDGSRILFAQGVEQPSPQFTLYHDCLGRK